MARVITIIAIRVENFEEYKAKHNLTLLREIRPPRKHHGSNRIMVSEDFQYTYEDGFRLAGDRLLARGLDGNQYQSPRDVTFIIQFPDPPSDPNFGSIIDYYQIVLTQSNNQFELYLEYGGAGYRRIKVVINMYQVTYFSVLAFIYGYN
ncbi:unnamed protein product [Hermetia illucens]|uniref:Uncharacterized protein n=1 Tax=Hermetia illucens TaxID=343691 RepID=A0A7R8UBM3_HERIL|nr:unnamed protein product [Hermetia illucens]